MGSNVAPSGVRFWQWLLPALCGLGFLAAFWNCPFGFLGKPWFGYWDSLTMPTGQPFVVQIAQSVPAGATARAGIRDGDRIDLREVAAYDRAALVFQPITRKPVRLVIHRGSRVFSASLNASTVYEGDAVSKIVPTVLELIGSLWVLGCALLVALRRWQTREGRLLCLTLVAFAVSVNLAPNSIAAPSGAVAAVLMFVGGAFAAAAAVFPVVLASTFGVRAPARSVLELAVALSAAASLFGYAAGAVGLWNLSLDPLPFIYGGWRIPYVLPYVLSLLAVAMATATTPRSERARAAWLLVPLPLSLLLYTVAATLTTTAPTWQSYMVITGTSQVAVLAAAAAVTYALLKRRVLDLEFVIARTLVVAGVSGIVVVSFVLLEWFLGSAVSSASHATGLVANAALALVLGLSMSFIHKRVDGFVEFAFFYKRHEDEHALRDFAREAAFVTSQEDLLDRTIETIRTHTDAEGAAIMLDGDGWFRPARWFGDEPACASENDALVLALKNKHEPIDPHRYSTALAGDVALPMSARGRLLGLLLCGRRHGGEAYAPDEIDALREMAHGVGSALDSLLHTDARNARDDAILLELRELRKVSERTSDALIDMLSKRRALD